MSSERIDTLLLPEDGRFPNRGYSVRDFIDEVSEPVRGDQRAESIVRQTIYSIILSSKGDSNFGLVNGIELSRAVARSFKHMFQLTPTRPDLSLVSAACYAFARRNVEPFCATWVVSTEEIIRAVEGYKESVYHVTQADKWLQSNKAIDRREHF